MQPTLDNRYAGFYEGAPHIDDWCRGCCKLLSKGDSGFYSACRNSRSLSLFFCVGCSPQQGEDYQRQDKDQEPEAAGS